MKAKTTILKNFKSLDLFGHGVGFDADGKSFLGAFLSLLSAIMVCAYSFYQFQLMCRYANTSVTYIFKNSAFADTDVIQYSGDKLGFNIAFGVIDWTNYKETEGIEKIGSLKARSMSFDVKTGKIETIPIHKCTEEDKKRFYKPSKVIAGNFDGLFTELYCITNPEKLVFNGDWDGDIAAGI